jgi:hypothetical protein
MPTLKFYDVKKKKTFTSDKFKLTTKKTKSGMRYFAVTTSPAGTQSYRIVSKEFYKKYK